MDKIIGIVGGVGPYAGLDLNQKIFDNTRTTGKDQDHLEVYLLSRPSDIEDRTAYLQQETGRDPAEGIVKTIEKLAAIGANVVGIPCNTAHSPTIYNGIRRRVAEKAIEVETLHMIEECYCHCRAALPWVKTFGLLSTMGTYQAGIYSRIFEQDEGCRVLYPREDGTRAVHEGVYNVEYGIKACPHPVSDTARAILNEQAQSLIRQGAEALILGCTEIPLTLKQAMFDVPVVDSTDALARALIRTAAPDKLKALTPVVYAETEAPAYFSE